MILLRMTKILQWFRAKYNSWLPLIIWGECSFSHKIMRFVWFDSLCVLHITLFHTSTHTEPTRQYRSKRMQEERRRKNCLYEQYAEQQKSHNNWLRWIRYGLKIVVYGLLFCDQFIRSNCNQSCYGFKLGSVRVWSPKFISYSAKLSSNSMVFDL